MIRRPPRSTLFPTRRSSDLMSFHAREVDDLGLWKIARSCHKLEYLNISYRTEFTEISICNIIHSCPDLQHLRSEEHTSELQSHVNLVCRLLLEKKKKPKNPT